MLCEIFASLTASLTERSPESTESTIRQRLRATPCSSCVELTNHFGSAWGWCFGRPAPALEARALGGVLLMFALLQEWNRGLLIAHADLELRAGRTDRQVPIPEPAHEVEGLTQRLLA